MRKLTNRLELLKKEKRMGLMTHVVVGYPTLEKSKEIIIAMAKSGSDFIELQIPFSDSIADGPVILEANRIAIENNIHTQDCLDAMKEISKETQVPLLFMGYFNSILSYGVESFLAEAKKAGAQGVIFPDIPLDSTDSYFYDLCEDLEIAPIFVVSPITPKERLDMIKKRARGFIYCVANFGITGETDGFYNKMEKYLASVKSTTSLPIAVGWGIKSKKDILNLGKNAEIAIVGSEMLRRLGESKGKEKEEVGKFIKELIK